MSTLDIIIFLITNFWFAVWHLELYYIRHMIMAVSIFESRKADKVYLFSTDH